MARTDYFDDPQAPRPNALVVAASAVVEDDGRILLIRRADSGMWALPGGGIELGESIVDCAVREVAEETGVRIDVTGLVGIYTDPRHVIAYDDGEVRQQFNICFRAAPQVGGRLRGSSESTDVSYVALTDVAQLGMHPTQALRIQHYVDQREGRLPSPYVG